MKKILYSALACSLFTFAACTKSETKTETTEIEKTETSANSGQSYGEKITPEGAVAAAELEKSMLAQDSMEVKFTGEIEEVCQMKGCWVTIKMPSGEAMRVMFGEDDYFVPKDVSGKNAIMQGVAYRKIIPVDEQRHYLEDAGKSKEEIMAITQPDTTITFNAKGIIIL
ncbi:DUF4920 domain-containing protein [Adhaeribacter sp. BT258]|uniref:DUF4920 domain-containing protein n=1 Tax=Adhaeribacter terrigena TaxID=2793070 RepID=A0ABS1BZX7_9BACT|nr:DUF4920 domain-containing protein [Adhaeribacter terrigena]MBK0402660.1 DUF4920 domain-containing protein [Adhaeribacter terrigena]